MPQPTKLSPDKSLVGRWKRQPAPAGAAAAQEMFPDLLEFEAGGLYRGTPASPGVFLLWDVGTYELEAAGRLRLSTANDAKISYAYTLRGGELTVEDGQGGKLTYRRIK